MAQLFYTLRVKPFKIPRKIVKAIKRNKNIVLELTFNTTKKKFGAIVEPIVKIQNAPH